MSVSETPGQATLSDVLTELRMQRVEVSGLRGELGGTRGEISGLRAELSASRSDHAAFRGDVLRRLDTLFEELANFRSEYNNHTHE